MSPDVTPRFKSKPRPKKKANQTKLCDAVFGKVIRSRGRCENETCGRATDLQCAHGFSRSYRATRWDERQCFCLCRSCHVYFTHRPLEWDEWMRRRMGEKLYSEVRTIALTAPNPPLSEMLASLRKRAQHLGIAA